MQRNSRSVGGPGHAAVLAVAAPIIASNLTTPLLGLVDTGVIGQLGDPVYIGAVSVGALIFNFVYWGFGFLRMGTTGLTAQAHGAQNHDEIKASLGRALLIAFVVGMLLILLQPLIGGIAFRLIDATPEVESGAARYFYIRIWSAPFALANFALLGWFIGRQQAHLAFLLQFFLNGMNIVLDALLVLKFDWGVAGIAAGTVVAETLAAIAGLALAGAQLKRLRGRLALNRLIEPALLRATMVVNRDIMIRSLLIMFAFIFFTARSAQSGNVILAANTLLMHFVMFSAFFLDGFAFAAEAFVGEALGAKNRPYLLRSIAVTTVWSALLALGLSLVILLGGRDFINLLTTDATVRTTAIHYLAWPAVLPVVSVWCWQLDGIFIGATRTVDMRNAAVLSLSTFFAAWWWSMPMANHGLWLSITLFNLFRALFLGYRLPALIRAG